MLTLWDLIERVIPTRRTRPKAAPKPKPKARPSSRSGKSSMLDRYEAVTQEMLARYGVKVRKWRKGMSGVAWLLHYHDGTTRRLIEAPRPKGPMSMAVFLHEIGHHAIGFNVYKPRCLEEFHAWAFALSEMERQGLNVTDAVRRRMHESLWYAVEKARRRGLRELPPELEPFRTRPARRRSQRSGDLSR